MDTDAASVAAAVGRAVGVETTGATTLDGGMVGSVHRVDLADGRAVVAKTGSTPLTVEARMLRYLGDRGLPVPDTLYASDAILVIEFVAGDDDGRMGTGAARDAGRRLAALHDHTEDRYGFPFDTLSGAYHQPNPWTDSWVAFFRDHRLRHVVRAARDEGSLPPALCDRVEALCADLGAHLPDDPPASLLHGDVWANNLIVDGDGVAAFLDPACSYGHAEVDLAYCGFVGMSDAFFEAYDRERGIDPGFRDGRRGVYRLLPELEHVRHFDADGYRGSVDATLSDLGH